MPPLAFSFSEKGTLTFACAFRFHSLCFRSLTFRIFYANGFHSGSRRFPVTAQYANGSFLGQKSANCNQRLELSSCNFEIFCLKVGYHLLLEQAKKNCWVCPRPMGAVCAKNFSIFLSRSRTFHSPSHRSGSRRNRSRGFVRVGEPGPPR